LKKGVAYIITGLHWFNPFAWAAFYFLCKDMETACDEETILALGLEHKQDYARVLLQISSGQKMFFGAPLAFGEGSVKSRIKHIVSFKKTWREVSVLAVVTVLILMVIFMTEEIARKKCFGT
jgi:beta-lactamase regulating signal transducer with metallopeptidase domain